MVSLTELSPLCQLTVILSRITAGWDGLGGWPLEHRSDWPWLLTNWVVKFARTTKGVPARVDLGTWVVLARMKVAGS